MFKQGISFAISCTLIWNAIYCRLRKVISALSLGFVFSITSTPSLGASGSPDGEPDIYPTVLQSAPSLELGRIALLLMPGGNTKLVGWNHLANSPIIRQTRDYAASKWADGTEHYSRNGIMRVADSNSSAALEPTPANHLESTDSCLSFPNQYRICGDVTLLGVLLLIVVLYFFPAIVAFGRNRHNKWAIFVLNLFLGWTLIGWVISLVWAVSSSPPPIVVTQLPPPNSKT